ncbi:MAG: ACP S-malonyltransferase [Lysobacteraceae bacterium]|nr:MAG: ACP S-malonyltransferase [Xanthomonadaceae bacterium]
MKIAWGFPGQGAQRKGMGAALFDRFPTQVAAADAVLGYSLRRLCLEDPDGTLGQTRFTQPALYAVSALDCMARREDGAGAPGPDVYVGHSLGEFVALFAAGAFDFETGVAIVAKRGALMTEAPRGAMAAVIGLEEARVRALLADSAYDRIELANINAPNQIVISGDYDQIGACAPLFTGAGARYVRLDVSAAFHSSFMRDAEREFAAYLETLTLRPLQAEVVANCTARPYPRSGYAELISRQITQPVRWYESISWLLAQGLEQFVEVGPGEVLTGLHARIRKSPMPMPAEPASPPSPPYLVFMYPDQGAQYHAMGRELYETHPVFRAAFDACDAIHQRLHDRRSLVAALYESEQPDAAISDLRLSAPALFAICHGLTCVLREAGITPDAVLGCGAGEFVAAVASGSLQVEDAMTQLARLADLVHANVGSGGMLAVQAGADTLRGSPTLIEGCAIAAEHYDGHCQISGDADRIDAARRLLEARDIVVSPLPVEHALHSQALDQADAAFAEGARDLAAADTAIPAYSCADGRAVARYDAERLWRALRAPVDFRSAVDALQRDKRCRFVDLGPSGDLAALLRHGYAGRVACHASIDRFGHDAIRLSRLIADLRA